MAAVEREYSLYVTRRCALGDLRLGQLWPPEGEWPPHPALLKFLQWRGQQPEGGLRIPGLGRPTYEIRRGHEAGATWCDRQRRIVFLVSWTSRMNLHAHVQRLEQRGELYPEEPDYDGQRAFEAYRWWVELKDRYGPELLAEAVELGGKRPAEQDRERCIIRLEAHRVSRMACLLLLEIDSRHCDPPLSPVQAQLVADAVSEHLGQRFEYANSLYGIHEHGRYIFEMLLEDH